MDVHSARQIARVWRNWIVIARNAAETATQQLTVQGRALFTCVSAAENCPNLVSQALCLTAYGSGKGFRVHHACQEMDSGVNNSCAKILNLLADARVAMIISKHKDRARGSPSATLKHCWSSGDGQ